MFCYVKDDEIDYVDLGGAYVGKQQKKILEVIKELGLETYHPLDYSLKSVMYVEIDSHFYLCILILICTLLGTSHAPSYGGECLYFTNVNKVSCLCTQRLALMLH